MGVQTEAIWALGIAVFVACLVEAVEAVTIVVAMGMTRSWRAAIAGTITGVVAVVAFAFAAGYAVVTWLPLAALQLVIGGLLLIFGLQWMRKAILRSAGRKELHDEAVIFKKHAAKAENAEQRTIFGFDQFAFIISLKGVFLEGVEVVFIIITFGLNANNVPVAAGAGIAAAVLVTIVAVVVRGPLTKVPENTLKYGVAVLLSTFGTFWAVEGLGIFSPTGHSLQWPGDTLALGVVLLGWLALSRVMVRILRVPTQDDRSVLVTDTPASEDAAH
jgi:uncharacterized membrane protein